MLGQRALNDVREDAGVAETLLTGMDLGTGTMVIASTRTLVIMRDYRKFFSDPTYTLELEAYISLRASVFSYQHPMTHPEKRSRDDWKRPWSLSVEDGRALFVGPVHMTSRIF